jgi:lariat debranching enzyme
VRFVILGDVHGSFSRVAAVLHEAESLLGRVDAALCVGDLEPNRNARDAAGVATGKGHRRWVGEYPKVLRGEIVLPAPLWFIGGDHEPWATLDSRGPGEISPGINFMGRAGVRDVKGLNVAFISGVRGVATEGDMFARHGRDERACWVRAEMIALERAIQKHERIDVFMSHDWPDQVLGEEGDAEVLKMSKLSEAPLHVCGHRHRRVEASDGDQAVLGLADITNPGGWAAFVRKTNGKIEQVG